MVSTSNRDQARAWTMVAVQAALFLAVAVAALTPPLGGESLWSSLPAGLVLVVLGAVGVVVSGRDLGRALTPLPIPNGEGLAARGLYRRVRHPMYSAFWLLALSQAALLPNWFAGLAGPVAWGTLFFLRVGREERLMIDTFGEQYRRYMQRTKRVLPWVY